MNFWFIGCFVLIFLLLIAVPVSHKVVDRLYEDKATASGKVVTLIVILVTLVSFLGVFAGISLHGKFKVEEMAREYEELIERVAYKDSLSELDRFILEQDVLDWNMKIMFNEERLNNFWSPMGNLYELEPILVEI